MLGGHLTKRYEDSSNSVIRCLGTDGGRLTMPDGKIFISRALTAVVLALATALSGCGGGAGPVDVSDLPRGMVNSGYPKPHDYPIHGIDVSKFQGDIDWNAVASSGVQFAWIKATEGGDRADAHFQANWTGAKAAGVPRGAYHFVYWCRSPMEEMAFFEQNAPVEDDALPPVLDVEATPTSPTCHRHLTQSGATADMKVMLEEMERHYGKRPIIYTTVDFYEAILSDGAFSDYPIWVRSTKHHPAVKYGSRAWAFWQYQSDGQTPGINGNVDRDVFYGTKVQWDAFLREQPSGPRQPTIQRALVQQLAAPEAAPAPQSATQQAAAAQQADDQQPAASDASNQEQ
jgi:lysozyme